MRNLSFAVLSFAVLTACAAPGVGGDLESGVGGEPLMLASGIAVAARTSFAVDGMVIRFSEEPLVCSDGPSPNWATDPSGLEIEVPSLEPGTYEDARFFAHTEGLGIGRIGRLVLTVDEHEVSGTVEFEPDDTEEPVWAHGSFRVPRCFD